MDHLKSWLERSDNPDSYYQLLDCPRFCQDRQRLLAAVRIATRFLHPYENHKTGEIVRRARSLQLLCATAGHTFADDVKWRAYDDQLKLRVRDDYFAQAPDADVRRWLLDQRAVAPDRLDEIAIFIIASDRSPLFEVTPQSSADLDSVQGVPSENGPNSSTPSRVGPPPLPTAASRSSAKPPPLRPRRQPANAVGSDNTDSSETAIDLEAVTTTLPAPYVAPISTAQSSGRPAVMAPPPKMSGQGSAMAIEQNELQLPTPVASNLGKREKMAYWLSGIFVAMAVVGIIILLSLRQSSRRSPTHRQAALHESSNRELIEHRPPWHDSLKG